MHQNADNKETDLMELLGVVLRRRNAIMIFVVSVVVVSGVLIGLNKHYKSEKAVTALENRLTVSQEKGKVEILQVDNDPLFVIFSFLKRLNATKVNYPAFINDLLFPENTGKMFFNINQNGHSSYIFTDAKYAYLFRTRYIGTVELLNSLLAAKSRMTDVQFARCVYNPVKDSYDKECAFYVYQQNRVSEKIAYAVQVSPVVIDLLFLDVVAASVNGFSDSNVRIEAKALSVSEKRELAESLAGVNESLFSGNILGLLVIISVMAIFVAIIGVFVLDSWTKNRDKLKKYI